MKKIISIFTLFFLTNINAEMRITNSLERLNTVPSFFSSHNRESNNNPGYNTACNYNVHYVLNKKRISFSWQKVAQINFNVTILRGEEKFKKIKELFKQGGIGFFLLPRIMCSDVFSVDKKIDLLQTAINCGFNVNTEYYVYIYGGNKQKEFEKYTLYTLFQLEELKDSSKNYQKIRDYLFSKGSHCSDENLLSDRYLSNNFYALFTENAFH